MNSIYYIFIILYVYYIHIYYIDNMLCSYVHVFKFHKFGFGNQVKGKLK